MTKEVLISLRGMQYLGVEEEAEEPIELITKGTYYFRNGSHFIKYEEMLDEYEGNTSNLLKITPNCIEHHKKGMVNVHMVFEKNKKTITFYETPYGNFQMGIATTNVELVETEDELRVRIEYVLDMNDQFVANCTMDIKITSKQK